MFEFIWSELLYKPVINALIFLYNNFSLGNLGIAVILLTVIIRIILLPLSIMSGKSRAFYERLAQDVKEIDEDYGSDYVKKREIIRELLKKNKVNPWGKAVVLGIQLVVLILLYRVFLAGMNPEGVHDSLYNFVAVPSEIQTRFLWFDISKRDFLMAVVVGVVLFLEITFTQRMKREILTRKELLYRLFFPLFTVGVLAILPSVKSIFILTSILFSVILILITNEIARAIDKKRSAGESPENKIDLNDITIKKVE